MGRIAWSSSCSRNAHDKNVLVRRAQSRINQAILRGEQASLDRSLRSVRALAARNWGHPNHPLRIKG
jgi:hypothetical protein